MCHFYMDKKVDGEKPKNKKKKKKKPDVKTDIKTDVKTDIKTDIKTETEEIKDEIKLEDTETSKITEHVVDHKKRLYDVVTNNGVKQMTKTQKKNFNRIRAKILAKQEKPIEIST